MKKITFFTGLLFTAIFSINAQINKPPRLLVGIVVDQMREDFLLRYYDQYSNDGFKRLVNQGTLCRNVQFNYTPTITAVGHASIYAGTTPKYHGIIGNSWYNRNSKKVVYCVTDSTEKIVGNENISVGVSPRNLLTTNISDELKIATNKKSKVISLSTKDRAAVLTAGHMADGAFWLDLTTGNYVTSTFYMDKLPEWLVQFNNQKLAFKYLEKEWNLLKPIESYPNCLNDDNNYEEILNGKQRPTFPYNLKELTPLNNPYFEVLNRSPFSNSLLADLAIHILKNTDMGKDQTTDMLNICFSATDPVGHTYGPLSLEINDTYLRLDLEIARVLKALDEYVGKDNYTLFLTADHGVGENPQYLIDNKVPAGSLDEKLIYEGAVQHLNQKLGNSQWIVAYRNDQFYFDHELIEKNKLALNNVQDMLAAFLLTQNGIAETYTAWQLMQNEYTESLAAKLQMGFNFKLSGDVRYLMQPGWYANMGVGATHNTAYMYDSHVPVIFYGKGVAQGVSYEYHTITDVAPTVSTLLNIKFPSATSGKPITEIFKKP